MSFHNRIRLPFYIRQPQYPTERNVFRKADGSSQVLSSVVRNTYQGITDYLPEDWHKKLIIALAHDTVNIENERYLTNIVLDSDYSIEWQEFKDYPVAQAKFTVQVTPFNASNSNCNTCEDYNQLSLVDDDLGTLAQGAVLSSNVLTNDSIVCSPFTTSIVSWNTTYLVAAPTISSVGVLAFTVKPSVAAANDILVATYRVTCGDGSYDEANVYSDFTGSAAGCNPPSALLVSAITNTTATVSWNAASPVPAGYTWELYDTLNLGTPLQSGTVVTSPKNLTGLVAGGSYLFVISSDCGSSSVQIAFSATGTTTGCGSFSFFYSDEITAASISYINCNGQMVNQPVIQSQTITFCALINTGSTTPYYFTTTALDPVVTYLGLC